MRKKNWLLTMLMLVATMAMPSMTWAQNTITPSKPSGKGTAESPYQISTAAELYWFAGLVNGDENVCDYNEETNSEGTQQNKDANATLTNNIVVNSNLLSSLEFSDGKVTNGSSFIAWTPIGTDNNPYSGTFDGKGYTISGLYLNNSSSYVGLFGDNSGTIKNVGIVDSYFRGQTYVGGVCGCNYNGTIENCYNNSTIIGTWGHIGGVCGFNKGGTINFCYNKSLISGDDTVPYIGGITGAITNNAKTTYCYNEGNVSGGSSVGGICGSLYNNYTSSEINLSNCYNTGTISGSGKVGSVCGSDNSGSIENCYYLSGTAENGVGVSSGSVSNVESKTEEEFASGAVAYLLNGKTSENPTWYQNIDNGQTVDAYPVLNNTHGTVYMGAPCTSAYSNTVGTIKNHTCSEEYNNGFNTCSLCGAMVYQQPIKNESGAYEIGNAGQLYWFAALVNGDTSVDNVTEADKTACAILTADITVNENVLDENGELNSGTFKEAWTPIGGNKENNFSGTFDGGNHIICGLYFNNSNSNYVGLFGASKGTIKNVGVVDSYFYGKDNVGGVCGLNNSTITNCYNNSIIKGTNNIGGICGSNAPDSEKESTITNCYNTGSISGTTNVGDVCGYNQATITNCYYLASEDDKNGGKTTEQFASGEVCYLLSQGTEGSVWGQQLGEDGDAYPVLGSDNKVYYGYENCTSQIYSNTVLSNTPVHNYDNGICKVCNVYQPATQNESDEYEIGNAGQLYWFAGLVNGTLDGVIQNKSANAILTDDITFTKNFTAIGNVETCMYEGTFDGKGHTVTVIQDLSNDVALFGYIGTCTIKNLKVTGTINTNVKYAAGIAMKKVGNTTTANIENCLSDIVIKSTLVGDGTHGGIIGNVDGTINIKNCAFTGKMEGSETNSCGGIIGWTQGTANITNSYVSATFTISNTGSNIASRGKGSINVTNCYYVYSLGGTVTGITKVDENTVTTGELCIILNNGTSDGTQPFGQQLEVDKYPIPGSAYKLITASKGDFDTYWSTFSDLTNDVTLSVPKDRTLAVYNVTVSGSTMTLRRRSDNQVAKEEGVLLKSNGEYVNVKANETNELTPVGYANNNLVATPSTAQTISAPTGYTLYRLTYNNVTNKTGLGFYLGGADGVKDGSRLKATPGKAYLKVSNSAFGSAPMQGFVIGEDDNTTGIDVITINGIDINGSKVDDSVYDLMGRKVSKPAKGIYINNGKKVIIK